MVKSKLDQTPRVVNIPWGRGGGQLWSNLATVGELSWEIWGEDGVCYWLEASQGNQRYLSTFFADMPRYLHVHIHITYVCMCMYASVDLC